MGHALVVIAVMERWPDGNVKIRVNVWTVVGGH